MSKVLIAYFSRADENYIDGQYQYIDIGNTERVVMLLKDMLDADIYKIEMTTPYSPDYKTCLAQAKNDLKNNARPSLVFAPRSLAAYSSIILAYPNYWGTIPMPVASFLEKYYWTGKRILPICTNEGSGMGTSERMILKLCPGASIRKGLSLKGSDVGSCKPILESWLKVHSFTKGASNDAET